jgi:RNA polymerase sigma-70 factor (ECF subfamily)
MSQKLAHIDVNDEELLVNKCLEDDRLYQEAFYRKFAPVMYAVCKNYASDRDEAMDFLQNGFISVFKNLHKYRFEGSLEGWVKRVIIFRTVESLRKQKRYNEIIAEYDEEPIVEPEEFELENIKTSAARIRDLVNKLPEKAGLILKLYAIEGYTHPEISEILGVSVGTSKSQLNRARKLLKEALQK